MNNNLACETSYLFNSDFFDESIDEDEYYSHCENLIETFGWDKVFESWENYLYQYCTTVDKVINFANWFWFYDGQKKYIPDPYKFISYFYYIMDLEPYKYDADTIMDSITIDVLLYAGNVYVDLQNNPRYIPEEDPKIIESVKKWRSQQYR